LQGYPIIPCNLCGTQENLQRQVIKEMLAYWDRRSPGRVRNIARGMANVVPSHLADATLFDFSALLAESAGRLPLLDVTPRRSR
jgi:tRNA 2-thiocytidine biosynthesis protein TtcA